MQVSPGVTGLCYPERTGGQGDGSPGQAMGVAQTNNVNSTRNILCVLRRFFIARSLPFHSGFLGGRMRTTPKPFTWGRVIAPEIVKEIRPARHPKGERQTGLKGDRFCVILTWKAQR